MSGRPSLYSKEVAEEICERLARGESLRKICAPPRDDFMPSMRTVLDWLDDEDKAAFRAKYVRAREVQADYLADEILEIADAPNATTNPETGQTELRDPQRDKLRVFARQWYASKLAPKKYGDKQTLEHTGPNGGPIQHDDSAAAAKLAALMEAARNRRDAG